MTKSAIHRNTHLLEENLWRLMLRLSLPGIVGMLIISLNSFIDAVFVGRLIGPDALAGVSLIFPLTILTTSLIGLIAAGSASVLSRAIGSGNTDIQRLLLSNLLTLSLVASIVLTLPGYVLAEQLVALMGGSGKVAAYGQEYYEIIIAGSFFSIFGLASSALIRAEGKIKQAMTFASIAVITDLILTPVFIRVLDMGISGAAWSTVLSMLLYSGINLSYFLSGNSSFAVGKIRLALEKQIIREVLSIGSSAFIMQLTNFVRQVFIFKSVAHYGTPEDLAFFGAVFRIFMFSVIPAFGLLQSLQPVVGMNYGAKNYERSIRALTVFRMGCILLLSVIVLPSLIAPDLVLSLLLPGQTFSAEAIFSFRLIMLVLPFAPLGSSGIIFFQALGKAKLAGMLSFGRELLFIPIILCVPAVFGSIGIYYSLAIENILYATTVLIITIKVANQFKNVKVTLV